jgi:hypothetical protein
MFIPVELTPPTVHCAVAGVPDLETSLSAFDATTYRKGLLAAPRPSWNTQLTKDIQHRLVPNIEHAADFRERLKFLPIQMM